MTASATSTKDRPATKPTFLARLRYRFDNALSRGPFIVIAYLAGLTLFIVFLTALIATLGEITFGGGLGHNFTEDLWQAMLRTLDSGTFAADSAWPSRVLALVVTLAGIFLAGSLIGLIASAVDQRVESLRRGRSAVIEDNHTLILGWSPQVPRIIAELVIANESLKDASIVVLSRTDKATVEDAIHAQVHDMRTTRVVCRNGDPSVPSDLERACIATARSIVVVRDVDGDAGVVKAILAMKALDGTFGGRHVVAELAEHDNARTIRTVTGGSVLTISSDDVVAEVTAQACQQPGLAAVFSDLLDFEGDEIYFAAIPELVGRTYGEAVLSFERASVIGRSVDGVVNLNPRPELVLSEDDELIVIAEDDSAIEYTGLPSLPVPEPNGSATAERSPVRVLVVGWSAFGAKVLQQLDEFLPSGSSIHIQVDADLATAPDTLLQEFEHATVTVGAGTGGPEDLMALGSADRFDQVIVLAYRDKLSVDDADARTLLSLLTLRLVWPIDTEDHVRIVAELLDQQNLTIAAPVGVDDLIVSDALASLMMAQLAERGELQAVFDDLFDAEGAVVALRPARRLVPPGEITYAAVVAAASAQGESAFGYRTAATSHVVMNPPKSAVVDLHDADQVLVIAGR